MSKNVKSENIQNAWLSAGMEIRGTARYIAYEKTREYYDDDVSNDVSGGIWIRNRRTKTGTA